MSSRIELRAYRVELELTTEQRRWCERATAAYRVAYNWGLTDWKRWYRWQRIVSAGKQDRARALLERWGSTVNYPNEKGPSAFGVHARLTREKREGTLKWITEIENAYVPREAIQALGKAYTAFFRRLKKHRSGNHSECGKGRRGRCSLGAPRRKHYRVDSGFVVDQSTAIHTRMRQLSPEGRHAGSCKAHTVAELHVPGLGWARAKKGQRLPNAHFRGSAEPGACSCAKPADQKKHQAGCPARRAKGAWEGDPGVELCGVGIRRWGGRWYASVRAWAPVTGRPRKADKRLAVEVGVRYRAVTFDGFKVGAFKDTRTDQTALRLERKRKLWERRMARRYRRGVATRQQSAGWREARAKVAMLHRKIAQLRADRIHHVSRAIVNSGASELVVRDMDVKNLLQRGAMATEESRRVRNLLADDVQKSGMGELRRQLEYKQRWAGGVTEVVDASEPETKRCSACGHVRQRAPGYPWFSCPSCGHADDRDTNAAMVRYDYRTPSGAPVADPGTRGPNGGKQFPRTAGRTGQPFAAPSGAEGGPDGDATSPPGSGNGALSASASSEKGATVSVATQASSGGMPPGHSSDPNREVRRC